MLQKNGQSGKDEIEEQHADAKCSAGFPIWCSYTNHESQEYEEQKQDGAQQSLIRHCISSSGVNGTVNEPGQR